MFDVVLRGYNRLQVQEVVSTILSGGELTGFQGFDVTFRGYERHQVDEWLSARLEQLPE